MGSKALQKRSRKTAFPEGDESCIPQRRDVGLKRQKQAGGMPHFLEEQAKQQQSLAGQVPAAASLDPSDVAIQQACNYKDIMLMYFIIIYIMYIYIIYIYILMFIIYLNMRFSNPIKYHN